MVIPSHLALDDRITEIRTGLIGWFRANARELPWRKTRDPYSVLVSEIMLQQTQVDRVVPYYTRFLEQFPTVNALAAAPIAEVIRVWSGLGYNRRAVNLHRAATMVVETMGGTFPDTPEGLVALPGVGTYTAGAVAAFAFERDVAFVDTNMRRVISRVMFGDVSVREQDVLTAARALAPPGKGWEWNQALIEFGALQCTARRPACVICPLSQSCAAYPTIQLQLAHDRAPRASNPDERFETSPRYYRGRIVEALRGLPSDDPGLNYEQLGTLVRNDFGDEDVPWLHELVQGLQRDGLALIAEEPARYDGKLANRSASGRVRLP